MSVFRGESLTKSYGRRTVVGDVDIEVRSGEIIALLGRNGAGKTTTFLMMAGLVKPDEGTIYLDDEDISRRTTPERARLGISYLPQENSVFLKASVGENLRLVIELQSYEQQEKEELARRLLEELGLDELVKQSAHSLSGGERRKLEICRALVIRPKFLLLDEPFTGIDPLTVIELQKILVSLKEKGIGIVISDHNVRDTLRITNRVYILDEGEILIAGSPDEVSSDSRARKRFLGKDFKLHGETLTLPLKSNGPLTSPPENREKGKNKEEAG
ncbi:MAG: LPS export ABC transporter ATP-binding protein [Clostridiales bacterium]|nr:LPS export ABC transporter ATP-binding protein [Clostridiales bacterium]